MSESEVIATALRKARRVQGLSIERLAVKASLHPNTVRTALKHGRMSMKTLDALCAALNVRIELTIAA